MLPFKFIHATTTEKPALCQLLLRAGHRAVNNVKWGLVDEEKKSRMKKSKQAWGGCYLKRMVRDAPLNVPGTLITLQRCFFPFTFFN